METVLQRYVDGFPNIEINNKSYITNLEIQHKDGQNTATGLRITDRQDNNLDSVRDFDLIIDATGRSSKFHQWLAAKDIEINEQRDDAEIVYYTRHYKLKQGIDEPSRHQEDPNMGDLGYMKYGVFQATPVTSR